MWPMTDSARRVVVGGNSTWTNDHFLLEAATKPNRGVN